MLGDIASYSKADQSIPLNHFSPIALFASNFCWV